jgi:hypothetical protein
MLQADSRVSDSGGSDSGGWWRHAAKDCLRMESKWPLVHCGLHCSCKQKPLQLASLLAARRRVLKDAKVMQP